MTLKFAIG